MSRPKRPRRPTARGPRKKTMKTLVLPKKKKTPTTPAVPEKPNAMARLGLLVQFCSPQIVARETGSADHVARKRPRNDGEFWIFDPESNKRRRYVDDASEALEQASSMEMQRHERSLLRQKQAIHYAVTLWKILNAHRITDDADEKHNCTLLKCRQTRLEISLWSARPSVQIHAHLHHCVRSLKFEDEDCYYCHFGHSYARPFSDDAWENDHRLHVCIKTHSGSEKPTSLCEFPHDRAMHHKVQNSLAVDHLYICNTSGNIHFCNPERCDLTDVHRTEPICPVSGLLQCTKAVDKFYRPNGAPDSESSLLFKSLRRRVISIERWGQNLLKKNSVAEIRAHINRLRPRVAKNRPQLFYLAMVQALLRVVDCQELVDVRRRLRLRMVEHASDRAINLVTTRHGKEHKGLVSLCDLGNEIFSVQRKVWLPPLITSHNAQGEFYKAISDTVVKLWYLVRLYLTPSASGRHRGRTAAALAAGPSPLLICGPNTTVPGSGALVVSSGPRPKAPDAAAKPCSPSTALGDFDMFIYPAMAAIREGISVQHGNTIYPLVPRDPVIEVLIPTPEELEKLYPSSSDFQHKQRLIRKTLQDAISFINKDPESLCLADLVVTELDIKAFPIGFTTSTMLDHIEKVIHNEARFS